MPGGKYPTGHVQSLELRQTRSLKNPYKASIAGTPFGVKGTGPGGHSETENTWKVLENSEPWSQAFSQVSPSLRLDTVHSGPRVPGIGPEGFISLPDTRTPFKGEH